MNQEKSYKIEISWKDDYLDRHTEKFKPSEEGIYAILTQALLGPGGPVPKRVTGVKVTEVKETK